MTKYYYGKVDKRIVNEILTTSFELAGNTQPFPMPAMVPLIVPLTCAFFSIDIWLQYTFADPNTYSTLQVITIIRIHISKMMFKYKLWSYKLWSKFITFLIIQRSLQR